MASFIRSTLWASTSRAPALGADIRTQLHPAGTASPLQTQIRTATKRGGGSSKNGRSSAGRRLGVKKFTDQFVAPGQIIVRQRGTQFHAGQHVGIGKDHTLFALQPGFVRFYASPLPFPHRAGPSAPAPDSPLAGLIKRPRALRQYIGIVARRGDTLPRAEEGAGRERRFWGAERGGVSGQQGVGAVGREGQAEQAGAEEAR